MGKNSLGVELIMYKNYSNLEKIKMGYALIMTKLFWKNARLIRRPNYIRNKRNIIYGKNLTTGYNLRISASFKKISIRIGDNVVLGDYCHIEGHKDIRIGSNVLIASRVFITDTSHGCYSGDFQDSPSISPNTRKIYNRSVIIGNNVWIGENVSILPGVSIDDGVIIGANSVVTKSIPKNAIAVGNPARIIKIYDKKSEKWINY